MQSANLANHLYCINILHEKIELIPSHNWSFYYIVNHATNNQFINNHTTETVLLLNKQSCEFHFYGTLAKKWENYFDLADITLHPDATESEIALTMVHNDFDELIDYLLEELNTRFFVPHDTYLIYDDENIYKQIMQAIKKSQQKIHLCYHFSVF